jgi:predicted TIM-barrel fold metal-dependent hydrolase
MCLPSPAPLFLRLVPWLWNLPPNDRRYYPLFVECVELGIPFCTRVGHTGPLRPSETGRPIPYLGEVALAARALEGLDDLALDADAKASFLGGNAARVFRINHPA